MALAGGLLQQAHAAWEAGDARQAANLADSLLQQQPGHRGALALLANCGARLGNPDLALAGLVPLLQATPDDAALCRAAADAWNMLGARRRVAGDPSGALRALRQAVALAPRHALAWLNTAGALSDLGRVAGARDALARHLEICPDDDEARVLDARLAAGDTPEQAAAQLERLSGDAQLEPAMAVADTLDRNGDATAARHAFDALFQRSGTGRRAPGLRAAMGRALALPAVYDSIEALDESRARFDAGLAELEQHWDAWLAGAEPALEQLAWCNFKLAYQGRDDLPLQRRFAALLEGAADTLLPQWRSPPTPPRRRRPRIGLLSSSWRDCTVGAYFGGWITWLRDAGYETRLYQLGIRDATTDRLAERAGHLHLHAEGPLEALVGSIRDDAPDLLLYPELGMDPRLMALAALRLAPVQAVAWGHPVTTGLSTMDAFFSCAAMEPEGAQAHYAEPLRLLPGLGVDYARPPAPPALTRAALDLPDDALLLLVPQSLFKLHPDLDPLLATVAAALPALRLVLFRAPRSAWTTATHQRLAAALAAAGGHERQLLWLPPQARDRYLAINAACDLMLDVPHWSGGNTSIDALLCGLPVVTAPGAFMRGRQSAAMLAMAGVAGELVTAGSDHLEARVLALLDDAEARVALRSRIADGLPRLFDGESARQSFLGHVAALCQGPDARHNS